MAIPSPPRFTGKAEKDIVALANYVGDLYKALQLEREYAETETVEEIEIDVNGATSANTPDTIVKRDASGNFAAGTMTGNAATASKWLTARTLSLTGDVTGSASVDGSAAISLATTLGAVANPNFTGNVSITNIGGLLRIKTGANASAGTATLVAGTVTVTNTLVTASTIIILTGQNSSGTHGQLTISARVAGTSFTITSTSGTDTRSIGWFFIEPAP